MQGRNAAAREWTLETAAADEKPAVGCQAAQLLLAGMGLVFLYCSGIYTMLLLLLCVCLCARSSCRGLIRVQLVSDGISLWGCC